MNPTFFTSIATLILLSTAPVNAEDIALNCTLRAGNRLPLGIDRHDVRKSGVHLKNLDQRSVSIGSRYITFRQAFGTYNNAWRINRTTLRINFKTVLQPAARVVINENGSCAGLKPAHLQAQAAPSNGWAARISALIR
jgi:hypothetical protein